MTPQELDEALKDIRRTRNLMVFFGFIPMIYLFSMVFVGTCSLDTQYLSVEIITAIVVLGLVWGIIGIKKYIPSVSKVGLAFLSLSFLGVILMSFVPYSEVLWWILGGLYVVGFVMFVLSAKVHWSLKFTNLGYYLLIAYVVAHGLTSEVCIKDDIIAYFGIATLIYPMLSSYLAVRWASKEFFKLMNDEK